jgi:hypothetical protein
MTKIDDLCDWLIIELFTYSSQSELKRLFLTCKRFNTIIKNDLRLFITMKYDWNEYTCQRIAEDGNLECLKYAHENSCPWNEGTCYHAAYNGHFECLKYAAL